ncbi:MAG: hypothetical protein HY835_13890 [Anaerolineae bacterium]|nr:hypothetical protein [Anaerolineae bacterium]
MHKVLLEGVKEIVGAQEAVALLKRAGKSSCAQAGLPLNRVNAVFIEQYGAQSGQGVALRAGRAVFKHGLNRWGEQAGITGMDYRLLPAPKRVRAGLQIMAGIFTLSTGLNVEISEEEQAWIWRVDSCAGDQDLHASAPMCFMVVGILQEFMGWVSGGKYYRITETRCTYAGAPTCTFRIEKKALE